MSKSEVYNPLEKINLAKSIEAELLNRSAVPLSSVSDIKGAGVYMLYYSGSFPAYAQLVKENKKSSAENPIYVGKAIPKGGRKGGLTGADGVLGTALRDRLSQHASSISQASNLELSDFTVKSLVLDDIWIPLGENVLIERFKPVWNIALDGFGNKDPGEGRKDQKGSPWDVLHPGRAFAVKLAASAVSPELLKQRVEDYLAGRTMARLPKAVARQEAERKAAAEDLIDEVL